MASVRKSQRRKCRENQTSLKELDMILPKKKKSIISPDIDDGEDESPDIGTASNYPLEEDEETMRSDVHVMLERFGADIGKAMQSKRHRLEAFTKSSLKSSNQRLKQLWKAQQGQTEKLTQDYSRQALSLLQQWESSGQKSAEQEQKLNNLFKQQQKLYQQARSTLGQRLKAVKHLYEQFVKTMEEIEKSHQAFLTGAQAELNKEMAVMQKKIMMDTQQQEMATMRKSLQSMLF